jgi:hypothetical protein
VRSSGRIPKEIPILLIGSDIGGRVFSEPTSTVLLSLHGAGILSRHKLYPEQDLILRWTEKNKEAEIRVVGHLGTQSGRHTYGVAFFDSHLNFWEIDFPPVSAIEQQLGVISLVCSSCKAIEKIDDTSVEADVCATNEGVIRDCKRCGTSTLWKPERGVANREPVPSPTARLPLFRPPPMPAPAPVPSPEANVSPSQAPASSPLPAREPEPPASPPSFYSSAKPSAQSSSQTQAGSDSDARGSVLTMPPEPDDPPRANRRKHPRVKVSYAACVRHPDRGDDVVRCEDMSKGGLRFKSGKQYYDRSLIEVAAPFTPGLPALFVPAQIVFIQEPEQQLFRYGVAFLQPPNSAPISSRPRPV